MKQLRVGFAGFLALSLISNAIPAYAQEACAPVPTIIGRVETVSFNEAALEFSLEQSFVFGDEASIDAYVGGEYSLDGDAAELGTLSFASEGTVVLPEQGDIVIVSASDECGQYDSFKTYTDLGFEKAAPLPLETMTISADNSAWSEPKQLRPNYASDRFKGMVTSLFSIFR